MKPVTAVVTALAMAFLAAVMLWVGFKSTTFGVSWTGGSMVLLGIIIAGAIVVGALTGGLMWLAFYSARKGYDDRIDEEFRNAPPSGRGSESEISR